MQLHETRDACVLQPFFSLKKKRCISLASKLNLQNQVSTLYHRTVRNQSCEMHCPYHNTPLFLQRTPERDLPLTF